MNNEFTMSLTSNFGVSLEKLGVTTTVKQQVDNIQVTIQHLKKCIDSQRKQQSELDLQLTKLISSSQNEWKSMLSEIRLQSKQQTESLIVERDKIKKQVDFLELQNSIVSSEHQKLNELFHSLSERIQGMEDSVGA